MTSLTSQSIQNNTSNQYLQNQNQINNSQQIKIDQSRKHFQNGKKYFRANQLQNAIDCFQKSISIDPDLLDSQYLIGVCYLSFQDFTKSIKEFNKLLQKSKTYKQNVYLLLSIAYKKKNDVQNAIQILGEAIENFPNYYDAYIYRGKLLVKIKKFSLAIQDFEVAISIDQTKALGFIGRSDCLRMLGNYSESIEYYTIAMEIDTTVKKTALLKRAITYSENNQIQESLNDLQKILDDDPCNSEANFFKGLQYQKQNNNNEATLAFEQAIKHNNSKKAVTKSLYELAKIKIQQRDFYQAFYTLQRSEFLDVDQETLKPFKIFTDSVTYLMKRKYQEGVDNLNQLVKILNNIKKSSSKDKDLTQNINVSMDMIGSGRNSTSQSDLLKQMVYNYRSYGLFCLGSHQKALQDLQQAEQINNGLEKPCQYNKLILQGILAINEFKYEEGFDFFKQAGVLQNQKMEPYMYKATGLIHQAKHKIPETDKTKKQQYFNNALLIMEKAESINNTNAVLYYARAILNFTLNNLEDAMRDIEKAIEKSEDNIASYFYTRGLIQASEFNYRAALQDFSITINLDEKYIKAYINRAKCYYLLEDRQSAFNDLQQYISLKPEDSKIHMHAGNLLFHIGAYEDAIKAYCRSGNIENNQNLLQLRINCNVSSKELNTALSDMNKIIEQNGSLEVKFDYNSLNAIKLASQVDQSQQDSSKKLIDCLKILKECNKTSKLNNNIEGKIFSKSDTKFYQGLIYFYLQQYDKSLKKFNKSIDCIKNQPHKNINVEEIIEEYRFENITYNIYEFQFNAAVCYIMVEQHEEAIKLLEQIEDIIPETDRKNLRKLIYSLEKEIDSEIQDKQNSKDIEAIEYEYLEIFPSHNRLCSIFPEIQLPLQKSKIGLRLSFCLPCVPAPSMEPSFDQTLVDKLSPTLVENKPEAPWIKKNAMGVIFTDNILDSNYDIDFTDTKRSKKEDEEEENQNQDQSEEQKQFEDMVNNDDSYYEYEDNEQNMEKEEKLRQFKINMQLDQDIEQKLKQLQKNKIN